MPSRTLVVPKLVRPITDARNGDNTTIQLLLDAGAGHVDGLLNAISPELPLEWVDNSPEDLRLATKEMLDGAYDQPLNPAQLQLLQTLRTLGNHRPAPVSPSFLARHS